MMNAINILNLLDEGSERLKVGIRKKINIDLIKLTTNTYFKAIPLKDLFNILKKYGVVALQEDNTEWSGMLAGASETVSFAIAPISSKVENRYFPYSNAMLFLQWYKMESGKYEITTYVS